MPNNIIERTWKRGKLIQIDDLKGIVCQSEAEGHIFRISGMDADGNVLPFSGTVSAVFLRPDMADVAIIGSMSGGVASVTLPDECYDIPGRFGLTVYVSEGDAKTAIYAAVGTIIRTSTGTVAPESTADVVDLINRLEEIIATIPESMPGLMADIAPTYSPDAVYPVGAYRYYNGDLYRCKVPITEAESWNSEHWETAVIGEDIKNAHDMACEVDSEQSNMLSTILDKYTVQTEIPGFWSVSTKKLNNDNSDSVHHSRLVPTKGFSRISGRTYMDASGYAVAYFDDQMEIIPEISVVGTGNVRFLESDGQALVIPSAAKYVSVSGWGTVTDYPIVFISDKSDTLSARLNTVPTPVRQSIYTLLKSALYENNDLSEYLNIVKSWSDVVTQLTISQASASISGSESVQLIATTTPSSASVVWESSDDTVATVNSIGQVTGVGNGTATITASAGSLSAFCEVSVTGFRIVTSIEAVYTQSGEVFSTDSLDSLRQDLVVTAHYNDSTSAVVTGYRLSGSLEAGTRTILVLFGEKTDTFDVEVLNGLPSGYTKYDYVKNVSTGTGGSSPAVSTGLNYIYGGTDYEHRLEFAYDSGTITTDSGLFGLRKQSGTQNDSMTLWQKYVSGNTASFYIPCKGTRTEWIDTPVGEKNVVVITHANGNCVVYVNGNVELNEAAGTFDVSSTAVFTLFKAQTGSESLTGGTGAITQYSRIYRYSVKNLNTGEYVAYMIPCKNASNEAGLYDVIRNSFHTAGGGANNLTAMND